MELVISQLSMMDPTLQAAWVSIAIMQMAKHKASKRVWMIRGACVILTMLVYTLLKSSFLLGDVGAGLMLGIMGTGSFSLLKDEVMAPFRRA